MLVTDKDFNRNVLIMYLPLLLLSIPVLIWFGESFMLLVVPLLINLAMVTSLAKRLSKKDAIAYSIVQYPSFILLGFLLLIFRRVGLGLIIDLPMIYIINTSLVFFYFHFAKNKKLLGKALTLLATLILTLPLYSEHYGPNSNTPMLFRLFTNISN